jgi:hypothetical protein
MAWYYAEGNEQKGPLTDEELADLASEGAVTGETLVWREGMAAWQSYDEVCAPNDGEQATGLTFAVTCGQCGQRVPTDEAVRIAGATICAACKPIAVQRLREGVSAIAGAEEIRQAHLKHEAALKSAGVLYLLGGTLLTLGGMAGVAGAIASTGPDGADGSVLVSGVVGALGVCQFAVGRGLRRFKPWTRTPVGLLSGMGLFAIPLGTLINAYILYLVFSRKGKTIMSEDYQAVIAATPHLKYKTSIIVWIFVGILILFVLLAIVGLLMGNR